MSLEASRLPHEEVFVSTSHRMAAISWSRNSRRNAFNSSLAAVFRERLAEVTHEDGIAVVILRGSGGMFCSGWDLTELRAARGNPESAQRIIRAGRDCLDQILRCPAIVVSVVEGVAMGFGVSLLCASDIVILTSSARVALPEIKHGIVPSSVLLDLANRVGASRALRWCLSGDDVGHLELLSSGLVSEVLPIDSFEEQLTLRLAEFGMLDSRSVRVSKNLMFSSPGFRAAGQPHRGDEFAISQIGAMTPAP